MASITLQDLIDNNSNGTLINKYIKGNSCKELQTAVEKGDLDRIKLLVSHGVDLNQNSNDAIYKAIIYKHINIITYLLDNGVDVNVDNSYLLKIACDNAGINIVKLLLEKGINIKPQSDYLFKFACEKNEVGLIKSLLEQNIEIKSNHFESAAQYGTIDIMILLLENKPDIDKSTLDSCLNTACCRGKLEMAKFLVEKGATVHNYNLIWTANYGYVEIVQFLLEKEVDVLYEDNKALRWAATNNHLEVIKILVNHGAPITDEIMRRGNTDTRKYLDRLKIVVYYGIESDTKLDIKLPDLLEIKRLGKYYYIYKCLPNVNGTGFTCPNIVTHYVVLSNFGEVQIFDL